MKAVVSTPRRPLPADVEASKREARRLGLPWIARGSRSLDALVAESGADVLLSVDERSRAIWLPGMSHQWRFHGGMAVLRIRRLLAGQQPDAFLDACALRPGDRFLDATGGAGADAWVAAHSVGPDGSVLLVEANPLLASVLDHGVRNIRFGETAIDEALERIAVRQGDHLELLRDLPDRSFDVVYFDPMFREAAKAAPGFDVIRTLADPRPLSLDALAEAKRVARRRVVVQDHPRSGELERLGVPERPMLGRWAPVRFGVVELP